MKIPNIDGYVTLKGDMHMHTIFSDASVWPTTRVDEAVMEGLDFLCITDHVDGRLHKYLNSGHFDPKNVDNNTSFKLAEKQAKGTGLILVPGGEMTSQIMPPGHFNATFVKDANPIGAAMDAHGKDHQPEGLLAACKIAKEKGITVSCDLNYRKKLWSRERANEVMSQLCQYVDVCIANEEDAGDVFGIYAENSDAIKGMVDELSYNAVAKQLQSKFGFRLVAITLRESMSASDNNWSAILYDGDNIYNSRKYAVHLVDRIGGGDSFSAGLIYGCLNGYDKQKTLDFAVAASCLKQTIEGDFNMVSVEEVENLMNGNVSGRITR